MLQGLFVHLDLDELTAMKAEWKTCLSNIASGHQSYSISGRTFTRANLKEVSDTLAEISYALNLKNGNVTRTTVADMSG